MFTYKEYINSGKEFDDWFIESYDSNPKALFEDAIIEFIVDSFSPIATVMEEEYRWTKAIGQVFEIKDNRFFIVNWEKGLTEYQPDEFFDDTISEVKPVEKQNTVTVWEDVNNI